MNFVTKRDASGNRDLLAIDHEKKIYKIDYNPFMYNFDYVDISKKQLNEIENIILKQGYKREV